MRVKTFSSRRMPVFFRISGIARAIASWTVGSRHGMLLIATVLTVLGCLRFLDEEVAFGAEHILHSSAFLSRLTARIPNLLLAMFCLATISMWISYWYVTREDKQSVQARFLRLAATALPVAYLLKKILQPLFGRTYTRSWLHNGAPLEFHWLTFSKTLGGFPSGHMTVFASFFISIGICYPSHRAYAATALAALGAALILTNYHFLSDVIAGIYCGFVATCFSQFLISRHKVE